MREPILATRQWTNERGSEMVMNVKGGLHYMRGNSLPYFALTYDQNDGSGGANHEYILEHYPQFADLAALHLSDIDGAPMHAEANAWYNLAGDLPANAGEQFHVGNSKRHFPKPVIDPAKPWDKTDYRFPTTDECLVLFAAYVRADLEKARSLRDFIATVGNRKLLANYPGIWKELRETEFKKFIDAQRPRWKQEADACIARHGLVVYGDKWEGR